MWDLSLVDPDNRRGVDYSVRTRMLGELEGMSVEDVVARMDEGLPKLYLIHKTLQLRNQLPEAFAGDATYEPLEAAGPEATRVVGFQRWGVVATVVPRLSMSHKGWEDTSVELPSGVWRNQLTGERLSGGPVKVAELLARFPVALLRLES